MSPVLLLIVVLAAANVEADQTCRKELDLLIGVDGSSTVCNGNEPCDKWDAILKFSKDIVNSLTIGKYFTRVAFITFSDTTNVEWDLNEYTDKSSLNSAIDNVKYPGGEFDDIVSAFKIVSGVFDPLIGDRILVQNIFILITDGAQNFEDWVYTVAATAVQADRVGIFVVCNTDGCTKHHAKSIASPPRQVNETYFLIDDYLKIDDVRDNLVKKFCAYQVDQTYFLIEDYLKIDDIRDTLVKRLCAHNPVRGLGQAPQ